MSLIAKEESKASYPLIPEGVYYAVCKSLIDLGEHHSKVYDKIQKRLLITWELPYETVEAEGEQQPRLLSKEYTNSLHSKADLHKDLVKLRGQNFTHEELRGFDLRGIIGTGCQIQVVHRESGTGKTYANIEAIMALPRGTQVERPAETTIFDLDEPGALDKLPTLPGWVQKRIKESLTYLYLSGQSSEEQPPFPADDDQPF